MRAITLVLIALGLVIGTTSVAIIAKDLELYISESDCVADKIKLGIPRADISTGHGTCWVPEHKLDNPINRRSALTHSMRQ